VYNNTTVMQTSTVPLSSGVLQCC